MGWAKSEYQSGPSCIVKITIAVDGIDHQLKCGIDNGTRLFRVEVLHQFHRALDIGEERRDRFAFTVERLWAVYFTYGDR